ncbi:MAG: hypothetical protein LBT26_05405, partial [Clostridiales Family XIII bacterium]|nr:hypothetical protein [Clostridiales Family XIII bacterium]
RSFFRQASLAEPVDTASISGTRRLAWRKKSSPLCPMFNCLIVGAITSGIICKITFFVVQYTKIANAPSLRAERSNPEHVIASRKMTPAPRPGASFRTFQ